MADAIIEFEMDTAYFREHHAEWIAACAPGWRQVRFLIRLMLAVGSGIAAAGVLQPDEPLLWGGLLIIGAGGALWLHARRAKDDWLAIAQSSRWSGKTVRFEVKDGMVHQRLDPSEAPAPTRVGELIETPNGYLFRMHVDNSPPIGKAASGKTASVYLPHRAIRPPMTREAFMALVTKIDRAEAP